MPVETGSRPSPMENWTISNILTREQARVFLRGSWSFATFPGRRGGRFIDPSSLLQSGGFGHGPEPALEDREVVALEALSHAGGMGGQNVRVVEGEPPVHLLPFFVAHAVLREDRAYGRLEKVRSLRRRRRSGAGEAEVAVRMSGSSRAARGR